MIKYFARNTLGRDFVVGDIHGCFDKVTEKLTTLNFDVTSDRLFSVGDLVDRGSQSEDALSWLNMPWFHAVRGNHEQMAIETYNGGWDASNYYRNGGAWFLGLIPREQQGFVEAFEAMPLIIEVSTASGPVGIVHAEYPSDDWDDKAEGVKDSHFRASLLWNRTRSDFVETGLVKNIDWIYCGHTIKNQRTVLGNHVYLDTGAVFGKELTIIEI